MSDFLKNLKSVFVVQSDSGSKPEATEKDLEKPVREEVASGDPTPSSSPVMDSREPVSGEINQKFTDILLKAIEANNQGGFDYLEYKRSLQNLDAMNMDEGTKFKSAFAAAQTMGVTPQTLVSSAEHYLKVLGNEEAKFGSALAKQKSSQIDGGMNHIKDLELSVENKRKQIAQLEKEISAAEDQYAKLKKEVEASAQKVERTKVNFVATYNDLVGQIKGDVENIRKYLS